MEEEDKKKHEAGARIVELKMKKSRCKAVFTRSKNKLINALNDEESTYELLTEQIDKLETVMDEAIQSIDNLCQEFKIQSKTTDMLAALSGVEEIEAEYEKVMKQYHALQSEEKNDADEGVKADIGKDLWKQLQRVSIPIFDGETRNYEAWKSAFMACVDNAPATKEYKLLQLRQYLRGNALKAIEDLGHSEPAYDAAKQRLERKYGGERRRVAKYIEDIDHFPAMTTKNAKQLDRFSDLLDIAVINIKEAGLDSELGTGMMYMTLQKKLPEQMLTNYHRWIVENEKKESVETLRDYVIQETEYHIIAQETKHGIGTSKQYKPGNRSFHTTHGQSARLCKLCSGTHGLWNCEKFKTLTVPDRWSKAKELKLCFRCLKDNHRGFDCRKYRQCNISGCKKTHDRLLHMDRAPETASLNPNAAPYQPDNLTSHSNTSSFVALRTIPVIIKSNNRSVRVNAMLDDGSTKTYINADIANELGLKGEIKRVAVNVLDGQVNTFQTMPVKFEIQSIDKNASFKVNAFTTNRVTGNMEVVDWSEQCKKFAHLRDINFHQIDSTRTIVDILIGLDHPEIHRSIKEVYGRPGEPYARLGPFGWTCIGKPFESEEEDQTFMTYFVNKDLGIMLKEFWEIEHVPETSYKDAQLTSHDKEVIDKVEQTMKYENDRYEVGIPWSRKPSVNSYTMAKSRLESVERKISKTPEIEKIYDATIRSYEEKGYISKLNPEQIENRQRWYLPHFPVVRMNKDTTKVRIVFDASAKIENECLNDCINEGPKLQNELFDVLLRFRKHPVALVCDISEMYLQIGLKPEDRPYHSFLWNSKANPPDVYEFNRVVFGVNASPFLAMLVSRRNAEKYQSEYPRAAETVLKSTYMDDSMDSVLNDDLGVQLYSELSALWKKAGMMARKWLSNSTKVLQSIPEEDRATEIDLNTGSLPTKKTLGILWEADADMFTYKANTEVENEKCTKRYVLKVIAKLFDPLGLVSPFIVQGKILMQKLWCDGYDWDDTIGDNLTNEIRHWFHGLSELNDIKVERSLNFNEDIESSALHVFVDASELAYAVTVYVRHEHEDSSIDVRLVCSKTKVAPLKATSIPRLELMAAVLGVRLAQNVLSALQMKINDVVYWSDSMNVLWWIHRESRLFKPFVANRVSEIHDKSIPNQWRHVPSKENPADIASRGMAARELVNCDMWWSGPKFLKTAPEYWPKNDIAEHKECKSEIRSQQKKYVEMNTFLTVTGINRELLDIEKYSRWHKVVRILAWALRFVSNISCKQNNRKHCELESEEIENAETSLIEQAQRECFSEEYKCLTKKMELPARSKILHLNPKIDEDGLLRCDTRLKFAKFMSHDARFPIILPRKNRITRLIVKHYHELNHHGGTNQVLASLSTRYWIEAAREEIREWEKLCCYCKRNKGKLSSQIMAPLPQIRLDMPLRAFAHTAVDYAGPYTTIQGRGKRREKRYLCLFTCLACRAVHLEMAYGLDTNSFLNAFYRFTSRRGVPVKMNSDNGTNFVGADRELKELINNLDTDHIQRQSSDKKIQWEFNPPSAPHFGGVHEAMIKSAKRAITKILGNAEITDEELVTAFVGAEGLLNSRPLTYQSSHPSDDVVLTPNHFLHGQLGGEFAPNAIDSTSFDPRKRWRYVQELVKHVWQRWLREFLPTLSARKKWFKTERDFKPGDVVIVIDPSTPRGQWPLGRIVEVFPGKDGHVRVATVRVGTNIMKRPISRLCFLEHCAI